jgi:glutamate racemase
MSIGIFDSGVGGITVLKEAQKQLPNENYIYYADTLHVPYGTKSKEEIKGYIFEAAGFLAQKGINMLVVACNTATSIAIKDLREKYSFPVIGMEPAVKPAVEKNGKSRKRVLVTATPLTLKEEKFQNLVSKVDNEHIVDVLPLPGLVEFAESLVFEEKTVGGYLEKELSSFDLDEYGTIVLGCTHFPLFKRVFKKILPSHVDIIDGNTGTVRHMKNIMNEKAILSESCKPGSLAFYSSKNTISDTERLIRVFNNNRLFDVD